jgi:hypothetical protein
MAAPQFKLDYREFNSTLEKYRDFHRKRSVPQIVNKKALYIARGAIRETQRPDKATIQKSLGQRIFDLVRTKSGRSRRTLKAGNLSAPLAALIVNYRRGQKNEKGLYGGEMKKAINSLVTHAIRARAFLASGWIPAVKKLSPLVRGKGDMPPDDSDARKIKNPSGRAVPATNNSTYSVAQIINDNLSKFTTTSKSEVFDKAARGLQKAIDRERISMERHIEEEMRNAAHESGIKTN